MRYASIGIPALSRQKCADARERRAGFTLIEALVAFSLLFAFAATLTPVMFHSREILLSGSSKVRAELLLRSLLQLPFNRLAPETGVRSGEDNGLRWRIDVESATDDIVPSDAGAFGGKTNRDTTWALYRVTAEVSWATGKMVKADTLRLGAVD